MAEPKEYLSLFLTNDILTVMVDETNLYATQHLGTLDDVGPRSRLHRWTPIDISEMKRFIGLIGWMGLVKVPKLSDYWNTSELYSLELPKTTMSRNRFELLLKFWHFANNENAPQGNRLHKCENVLNMFIETFKNSYRPGQQICIDETMVP